MVYWMSDDRMTKHFCPWPNYHIEIPQRLEAINQRMVDCDLFDRVTRLHSRMATEEELGVVHTKRYIEDVKSTANMSVEELEQFCGRYEDIYLNQESYEIAKLAAGSTIDLVNTVFKTRRPGFASVRPPGHHASPDAGCGFCIFNNVVLGAKHALRAGAKRVLIVDWDVHAGQGTQECIENEENIRLVSIHRFEDGKFWPNLQQSAVKTEFNNTVNVPLNKTGMTDSDYMAIMELIVVPMIYDYRPDLVIVSCGFDAAFGDPEGEMVVTPGGFGTMANILLNTGIPTAFILEGGYFLESVACCTEFVLRALLEDIAPHLDFQPLTPELVPVIRRVHKQYEKEYPFFEALGKLKNIKTSTFSTEYDNQPEFRGIRNMTIPYPTRGLYNPRDPEFERELLDDLDDIVNGYKKADYQHVILQLSSSGDIEIESSVEAIILKLPASLMPLAFVTLVLPINPKSTFYAFNGHSHPNLEDIKQFANFLEQHKNNEIFSSLPIYEI